jgi:hypothetical protein
MTKEERARKKYGQLSPKIAESDTESLGQNLIHKPWVMVCVDLVGPFKIRTPAKTHSLLALTMISRKKIVEAINKSATSIRDLFHNTWLARYPQP